MESDQICFERRKWPRAEFSAMAHVFAANSPSKIYGVDNLSAGGALLIGEANLLIGQMIKLTIELSEYSLVQVNARVLRIQSDCQGEPAFAVSFRNIDPTTEDTIQNAVLTRLEQTFHSQVPYVLIAKSSEGTCRNLISDLQSLSRKVVSAHSNQEAMNILRNDGIRCDVVFIDLSSEPHLIDHEQLLKFLRDTYPRIHRVAIVSQKAQDTDDHFILNVRNAHRVLSKPYKRATLLEILQAA